MPACLSLLQLGWTCFFSSACYGAVSWFCQRSVPSSRLLCRAQCCGAVLPGPVLSSTLMGVPTLPEISCSQEPPLLPCTCICVHGCVQNHTLTCKDFPAHTPVHSHTRVCTPLHSPMCALHPWASKSVQNQKALCKDLDAHTRVHAHTCVHTIPLHYHVHEDTSTAPALHTAMCTHTHAKLSPASTVHAATRNARSEVQHHL